MGTDSTRRRPARPAGSAGLFSFPNPVNEVSARLVAAGVVAHVRAHHRLRPALGDGRHRLRLRGPRPHRPDPQPARPVRDPGRHATPGPTPSARWPGRPSASPRAWASPSP